MTPARQNPGVAAALIQRAAELIKTSANLGGTGRSFSELEAIAEAVAAERERCAKERDELIAALREAETVMMIVQPRSHMKDYLSALETVRAALARADAS